MGDRLQTGKPFRYAISHPGQLSLAIPPWVGAMSTSNSSGANRHSTQCTSGGAEIDGHEIDGHENDGHENAGHVSGV